MDEQNDRPAPIVGRDDGGERRKAGNREESQHLTCVPLITLRSFAREPKIGQKPRLDGGRDVSQRGSNVDMENQWFAVSFASARAC